MVSNEHQTTPINLPVPETSIVAHDRLPCMNLLLDKQRVKEELLEGFLMFSVLDFRYVQGAIGWVGNMRWLRSFL
jgi:hypothetical protein